MNNFLSNLTEGERSFLLNSQRLPKLPGISTLREDNFQFALQYFFHGRIVFWGGIKEVGPPNFLEHKGEDGKFSIYIFNVIKRRPPATPTGKKHRSKSVRIISKVPDYSITPATAIGAWEITDEGLAKLLEHPHLPTLRSHAKLADAVERAGYESLTNEEKRCWETACKRAGHATDSRFAHTAILAECQERESQNAELAQRLATDVKRKKSQEWRSPEIRSDFRRFRN